MTEPPNFYDETERIIWASAFAKGDPKYSNWSKYLAAQHANEILQGYRELRSIPGAYRIQVKNEYEAAFEPVI